MYRYIDPLEKKLVLVAAKRELIPEWFYKLFVLICGNTMGTMQPFRWLLHREIKERSNDQ